MRTSSIFSLYDSEGNYEVEIFDHPKPATVIVCAHGNGVRRWDGEKFFYAVAEHFAKSAVLLVDQNQPDGDGVRLSPLPILVSRVTGLVHEARQRYPNTPLVVMGHSMGCGVASLLDTNDIQAMVFVAPAVGKPRQSLVERYGPDIVNGKTVTTSEGLKKVVTAEYYKSVEDIDWEESYASLVKRFQTVYVYESGDDEIVGDGRFRHRAIPFAQYTVIDGAKHNLSGAPLAVLFGLIDGLQF